MGYTEPVTKTGVTAPFQLTVLGLARKAAMTRRGRTQRDITGWLRDHGVDAEILDRTTITGGSR